MGAERAVQSLPAYGKAVLVRDLPGGCYEAEKICKNTSSSLLFRHGLGRHGSHEQNRCIPVYNKGRWYLSSGEAVSELHLSAAGQRSVQDFCRAASEITSSQNCFLVESKESDQLIFISCLPWIDVTGLTNEGMTDPSDSIPRIAWGQYQEENGKLMLGMSLEVNHRLIDGLHVGQFYENFGTILEQLPREI